MARGRLACINWVRWITKSDKRVGKEDPTKCPGGRNALRNGGNGRNIGVNAMEGRNVKRLQCVGIADVTQRNQDGDII